MTTKNSKSQPAQDPAQSLYARLRQVAYWTGLRRPSRPQASGMKLYRQKSAWALQPNSCACDLQFVEYLKHAEIKGKSIFHFGTGSHHIVALQNQAIEPPNEILGINASVPEHKAYVELVLQDPSLAKYYKVLFADIYTLTAKLLPNFDVVSLFHLGEFYLPENAALTHQTDTSLVQLFLDKLNPNGKILFYQRSRDWESAQPVIESFVRSEKIHQTDRYENLLIYEKCD